MQVPSTTHCRIVAGTCGDPEEKILTGCTFGDLTGSLSLTPPTWQASSPCDLRYFPVPSSRFPVPSPTDKTQVLDLSTDG